MSDQAEDSNKVSVSWKYLSNVLVGALLVIFGFVGQYVIGRLDHQEDAIKQIPILSKQLDLHMQNQSEINARLTQAIDKLNDQLYLNQHRSGKGYE